MTLNSVLFEGRVDAFEQDAAGNFGICEGSDAKVRFTVPSNAMTRQLVDAVPCGVRLVGSLRGSSRTVLGLTLIAEHFEIQARHRLRVEQSWLLDEEDIDDAR